MYRFSKGHNSAGQQYNKGLFFFFFELLFLGMFLLFYSVEGFNTSLKSLKVFALLWQVSCVSTELSSAVVLLLEHCLYSIHTSDVTSVFYRGLVWLSLKFLDKTEVY